MERHSGSYGAMDFHGRRFKTKKALREAVELDPKEVAIENMSMFGSGPGGQAIFMVSEIPPGHSYGTIAGPDPSRDRKWYATIERRTDGTFKVA